MDPGQRTPIGGHHGHTVIFHLRLGRSRIKILTATSSRCVGRDRGVESGKSSLKGMGRERETARERTSPPFSPMEEELIPTNQGGSISGVST